MADWLTPTPTPLLLRPLVWLAERMAGGPLRLARLLAMKPKLALSAGVMEACAASAPRDLEPRTLATARLVASLTAGCPFCLDMNAATWRRARLSADELAHIFSGDPARWAALGQREALAARYARVLSQTPVALDDALRAELARAFSPPELVTLAATIAQVNLWSRMSQGLDVPPLGLAAAASCPVAPPGADVATADRATSHAVRRCAAPKPLHRMTGCGASGLFDLARVLSYGVQSAAHGQLARAAPSPSATHTGSQTKWISCSSPPHSRAAS